MAGELMPLTTPDHVEANVVLEGVGARQVVVVLVAVAEHETAGLIDLAADRLAADGGTDVPEGEVTDGDREAIVGGIGIELRQRVRRARRARIGDDHPATRSTRSGLA